MQVIECPATPLALPAGGAVQVRTVRWVLPEWPGKPDDPPGLPLTWARKPAFLVGDRCLRAEFAILDQLRLQGWHGGVWVNAFGNELRAAWFPAPGFRDPRPAGAPPWAAAVFDELRAANGGKLTGFFDVFAWREPGQIGFFEAKVGPDSIRPSQCAFLETALQFRSLDEFTIIEFGRERRGHPARSRRARQPGTPSNATTERAAIEHVIAAERAAGRIPEDVRRAGKPYDISSPPRKIEIKAFLCELCEMDRSFCVHGQGDRRKAATVAADKLLISSKGMAHFEGCPHKGDDQDYERWAELDLPRAWERLGNGEHLQATGGKRPSLVARARCQDCVSHGPW